MNKQAINAIRKQGQGGFTLIELIVVIVILGILAATALPRFIDMGRDARVAALNGLRGSLNSTSAMAHARFLVNPNAAVNAEGVVVGMTNGYPTANNTLLQAAGIDINGLDYLIVTQANSGGNNPVIAAGQIAVVPNSVANTTAGATCFVSYTQAAANGAPAIAMNINGC
ncbi:Tfp pilus assembly protein FimT/FimU [Massilia sp. BJB1822]|uniref:pilus assembly FimT family protein n=1 Tax=Massilia sp. BJB1822 TaxID=2744470 RepID=UPI001594BF61|nr:type II secretion system protein [Massilia sp. BJB1822]NVD97510.1 type II secretion system protein [Massilia sp. BJB1822]